MTANNEADSIAAPDDELDVDAILAARRQIAVIWGIEDVQNVRPDLDDDSAWKVLKDCAKAHDCDIGFNWEHIRIVADDLYPEPTD